MSTIVDVLPLSATIGSGTAEDRAQDTALSLRIGVEVGQLFDDELTTCAKRGTSPRLRGVAVAETRRRKGLS